MNEGNQAVGVPDYLFNANIEWDVPFAPALTLTGRVVHTGEQAANITNTLLLETWTRFDIGARYVTLVGSRPLTLRVGVDNVTNEAYWASALKDVVSRGYIDDCSRYRGGPQSGVVDCFRGHQGVRTK